MHTAEKEGGAKKTDNKVTCMAIKRATCSCNCRERLVGNGDSGTPQVAYVRVGAPVP